MDSQRWRRGWLAFFLFSLLALLLGAFLLYSRMPRSPSWEIELLTPTPEPLKQAYIGGEVNSPGLYPISPEQSLEELIQAAGGLKPQADTERLEIRVPRQEEGPQTQRVNINTAQPWLLKALPDIGDELARAIVADRQLRGPFRSPEEIMRVKGIGAKTYEKIKELITVGD